MNRVLTRARRSRCDFRPLLLSLVFLIPGCSSTPGVEIERNAHISIVGNTLAERMQHFGHFETRLQARFPEHNLFVRNLGYSADEVSFRPRSLNWGSPDEHLKMWETDVVLAFFGFNESFKGAQGLESFKIELEEWIRHSREQQYNGTSPPQLVLVSPIAYEDLKSPNYPDGSAQNANLEIYTEAMASVAEQHEVAFVDVFTPTLQAMSQSSEPWTINGFHLSESGYARFATILDEALFGAHPEPDRITPRLRTEVNEKNFFFFHRYRAVNGYYIYGGRSERDHGNPPFTDAYVLANERGKLDDMVGLRDARVWKVAQGLPVSPEIDDSKTRPLYDVPTNFHQPVNILSPQDAVKTFKMAPGYAVNLFASEVEFPELKNPVQLTFDNRGRLWILTMPDYPMFLPPERPNDRLLILEDSDQDGRADKLTVFADRLHVPTGFELGDGGVYVAQQPDLVFLKDTDGDDKADVRKTILHGFDSADSHHSISAFTWGPGGGLYMHEGTFHHTSVETSSGPVRNAHGGVYRYDPTTQDFETFVTYNFANPWGHTFDRWGQNFVADASGGNNYYATAFSGKAPQFTGQPDFGPFKFVNRSRMKQFIVKRVRPTAGCEIVSSRHFPPSAQGNFLLNNVIGFQGILQHTIEDEGSGFKGTEIEPILFSSDRNFRPTDLQFGPDGALYFVDWFNPLVGHMQHNLRDPNRDKSHGRVWRITYPSRPLLTPPKIAGAPIPALLDLLKSYEDRTRYRVRLELRNHEASRVTSALDDWLRALDPQEEDHAHHLLEALWVYQHHNVVNVELLQRLLSSPDYRARAAATRVLTFWRDRVDGALDLLSLQASDPHPRVRLEAVRGASFFETPAAAELALQILQQPMDEYLDYTLHETIRTLKPYWLPVVASGRPFAASNLKGTQYLLEQLNIDELQRASRNRPVYQALLTRPDVPRSFRQEAVEGLVKLNFSSPISELLAAIERLDAAEETDDSVLTDLGRLLESQPPTDLKQARQDILQTGTTVSGSTARRLINVALAVGDQGLDTLWDGAKSEDALLHLVESIPLISDSTLRTSSYPRLAALVDPSTPGRSAASVRTAAIQALPSIPGREPESLHLLTGFVRSGRPEPAVIESIRALPPDKMDRADVAPMLEGLLKYIASVPPTRRTSDTPAVAASLAADLTGLLPGQQAETFRSRLDDLSVTVIRIRPIPHRMQYDLSEIFVEAGRPVEIVFENVDIMPHNLLVTKPGAMLEVGLAAEAMASRPDAFQRQFIPDSSKVLYASRMLQPQETQRLQFTAPRELGEYPYLCTFPGHWRTMFGTMHVLEDAEGMSPILTDPGQGDVQMREFVKSWTVADLTASLRMLDADRNFPNGAHLFSALTCNKCHQMNGEGGKVGPDLTLVLDKMAAGELDRAALLREVLEPSKVVADEYKTEVIRTKRGLLFSGVVSYEDDQVVRLISNPLESEAAEEVAKESIEERWTSTVSMMPEGLVNTATARDVMDLIAYIATRGGLKPTEASPQHDHTAGGGAH